VLPQIDPQFEWDEMVLDDPSPYSNILLSIAVVRESQVHLIGTAYIFQCNGDHSFAISAAHNFDEVRKILHPNQRHHPSTPPDFLPPPSDLDSHSIKALYIKDKRPYFCSIDFAVWDSEKDLAVLRVNAPSGAGGLFRDMIWIVPRTPNIGDAIALIGVGEMNSEPDPTEPGKGRLQRRVVVRGGKVIGVFPERSPLVKGPSVETSIAVFGGMSGGIACSFPEPNARLEAFGLISYSPGSEHLNDRSVCGYTYVSLLQPTITSLGENRQKLEFAVNFSGVAKVL
jgi:hypothetical protein